VVGENDGEGCAGGGEAAFGEESAEFVEGAVDSHAGGVFGEAELGADFGEGLLRDKPEEDGGAVGFGELVDGVVENWRQAAPVGGGFDGRGAICFVHGGGDGFAGFPAALAADGGGGFVARGRVEPGGEERVIGEGAGLTCESNKDGLGDVLREVGVEGDAAKGGRVNAVEVTPDEFREGGFGAIGGVTAEEFGVGQYL